MWNLKKGIHKFPVYILCLFVTCLLFNESTGQGVSANERNRIRQLAAQKCLEYTEPINQQFESLPLVSGSEPESISIPVCDGDGSEPLIVGGEPAKAGEFPHMAAIGYNNFDGDFKWFCGGTLISNRFVLTAAHCGAKFREGTPRVRLGLINLDGTTPNHQEFGIEKFTKHPLHNYTTKFNDIALIKLDRDVHISRGVRPACLFTDEISNHANVVATGWGSISYLGPTSDRLLKVGLQVKPHGDCQTLYKNSLSNSMLCAGSSTKDVQRDACQGDSGGPLVVSKENYHCIYYLVGVTSFGKACGLVPGIYTKVSDYSDWIADKIW